MMNGSIHAFLPNAPHPRAVAISVTFHSSNKFGTGNFSNLMLSFDKLSDDRLDGWRQRVHSLDVGSRRPQIAVLGIHTIGKHARPANAVFRHPKYLRFSVLRPNHWQFGNDREQDGAFAIFRFSRSAMAPGATVEIKFRAREQI